MIMCEAPVCDNGERNRGAEVRCEAILPGTTSLVSGSSSPERTMYQLSAPWAPRSATIPRSGKRRERAQVELGRSSILVKFALLLRL